MSAGSASSDGRDEEQVRRDLRIRPLGDRAAVAEIGTFTATGGFDPAPADVETSAATLALARRVSAALGASARSVVPAYRSVLVEYDPDRIPFSELSDVIRRCLPGGDPATVAPHRTVTIPVCYGGDLGPDLDFVAAHTGLSPQDVIAAHHGGGDYRVAFLGFSPGYAYLLGLPPELSTPRLSSPRSRVPPGSVAIGGRQTAIYPQATPGGWRLIGRTAVPLFDVDREPAALLAAGDRLVFQAVDRDTYEETAEAVRRGRYQPDVVSSCPDEVITRRAPERPTVVRSGAFFEVLAAGLLTTVQDQGRPGRVGQGVSPGGAMDRAAALAANRLVGNPSDAAVLEMGLAGPTLRPNRSVTVALTGARLGAVVDGEPAPDWEPFTIPAGGTLSFSPERAERRGLRGYLAVGGGIDVPSVLGSRSTDLTAGFGGLDGRALVAGDRLPIGATPVDRRRSNVVVAPRPRPSGPVVTLRVVVGPQEDLLADGDLDRFLAGSYAVTAQSSHMGVRLSGPALRILGAGDLVSEGTATGAVQVPADGQPIILLAGRGTVGGYARVAGVIDADLDLAAQLRPGTTVRFRAVTLAEAALASRRYREALGWLEGRNDGPFQTADPRAASVRLAAARLLERARAAIAGSQPGTAVATPGAVGHDSGEAAR